jgi:hypothetical protein
MAVTKSVGAVIDAPAIAPAPYGLVNSATLQRDVDRWEGGVSFESLACAANIEIWGLCDSDGSPVIDNSGADRVVHAPAFGITATDTCSSTMAGSAFREVAAQRAEALLEASTQKALEWELKRGLVASTSTPPGRWLTGPGVVDITTDSTGHCPQAAVAMLQDAYSACGYGGPGVLHLTPGTAGGLRLTEDGDVLRTANGDLAIAGAGYAEPSGGEVWAFITGPTYVWLGEITTYPDSMSQAVSIATNDIRYKAERLAAVTFDGCCAFAVKVDLAKICN